MQLLPAEECPWICWWDWCEWEAFNYAWGCYDGPWQRAWVISGHTPGMKLVVPINDGDDPEPDLAAHFDFDYCRFLIEHAFDVEHEPFSEWLEASQVWEVELVD